MKVYQDQREPGGYGAKCVMIPWTAIADIEIMAIDATEQPF